MTFPLAAFSVFSSVFRPAATSDSHYPVSDKSENDPHEILDFFGTPISAGRDLYLALGKRSSVRLNPPP